MLRVLIWGLGVTLAVVAGYAIGEVCGEIEDRLCNGPQEGHAPPAEARGCVVVLVVTGSEEAEEPPEQGAPA